MKTKKAGAVGMDGNGESDASLHLSDETRAGTADPNDRGMPGISIRNQQQDMPDGSMDHGRDLQAQDMPAGGMDEIDHGGGGAGGRDDDGADGGVPTRRSCGTMAVHRRLLSTNPAYARARDQIEDHARSYERGEASA